MALGGRGTAIVAGALALAFGLAGCEGAGGGPPADGPAVVRGGVDGAPAAAPGAAPESEAHEGASAEPAPAPAPADAPAADEAAETVLTCSATVPETNPPLVWRLEIVRAADALTVSARMGGMHPPVREWQAPLPEPIEEPAEGICYQLGWTFPSGALALTLDADHEAGFWVGALTLGEAAPLPATCWDPSPERPGLYDGTTGRCVDESGLDHRNRVPIAFVRETADGHCADLRGVALEEGDLYYPALLGWDLQGADLRGAQLHFADLRDADLRGADLRELDFGYAVVEGRVDAWTQPQPLEGEEDGRIRWSR